MQGSRATLLSAIRKASRSPIRYATKQAPRRTDRRFIGEHLRPGAFHRLQHASPAIINLQRLIQRRRDVVACLGRRRSDLGYMYAQGRGVAKDDLQAVGEASAQTNLGYMYTQGRGVAKDDAQAVEWYPQGGRARRGEGSDRSRRHVP